ncbi:MAG TPA: hypothetical protein VGC42_03165 [Kofleriaceae bacterium]
MHEGEGPFRKLAVTRWSRPRGRFERPAAAIGLLGVLLVAAIVPFYGVGLACALVPALALASSIPAGMRYRRARARLAQLPFPLRHVQPNPGDPFSLNRVGIEAVEITVVHELDRVVCDAIAGDAERRVPGLSATVLAELGVIRLGRWAWGGEDLGALAELLDTWGRELHDRATIRAVEIRWRAGAPV